MIYYIRGGSGLQLIISWSFILFVLNVQIHASSCPITQSVFVHYHSYPTESVLVVSEEKALYRSTINQSTTDNNCVWSSSLYCCVCTTGRRTPGGTNSTSWILLCQSLDHLPQALHNITSSSLSQTDNGGSMFIGLTQARVSLSKRIVFQTYADIVIANVGSNSTTIHCRSDTRVELLNNSIGIDIRNITRNVYLYNIVVSGCGGVDSDGAGAYYGNHQSAYTATSINTAMTMGSVCIEYCLSNVVIIERVTFTHSICSGLVIMERCGPHMYSKRLVERDCVLVGGAVAEGNGSCSCDWSMKPCPTTAHDSVSVTIDDCRFISNNHNLSSTSVPTYGGGVFIMKRDSCSLLLDITINNSVFHDNQAMFGGGMAASIMMGSTLITIANTSFSQNTAYTDGGGYYQMMGGSEVVVGGANATKLATTFDHCQFLSNHALHYGGAVVFISSVADSQLLLPVVLKFSNTIFTGNKAPDHAVMYVHHTYPPLLNNTLLLEDIIMEGNLIYPQVFDTQHCLIYLSNINGISSKSTQFMHNYGTVMCLDNANMHMEDNVKFSYNLGYKGGALNLQGESTVYLHDNVSLLFIKNSATYGGAIFRKSVMKSLCHHDDVNGDCIFNVASTQNGYLVQFINNHASLSGYAIFHSLPDEEEDSSDCDMQCLHRIESNAHVIFQPPNSSLNLGSSVVNITFSYPVYWDDDIDSYVLYVSLGIHLTFTFHIKSGVSLQQQFDSAAMFYVSFLQGNESYSGNALVLNGPVSLSLSEGLTITNIYFTGDHYFSNHKDVEAANFSLKFNLADNYAVSADIKLRFVPCKLGFQYCYQERKCVCIQSPHILCNERLNLSCIERGFWHGTDGATIPCYSGHCKNSFKSCSLCLIEDGGSEFCKLQSTQIDECRNNHGGLACVYCVEGYVYTYAAENCIRRESCNIARDIPILICGCVGFLIAIMAMLYFVLKLDNEKNFGYLYVITYFYSVIGFVLPTNRGIQLLVPELVIQSIINLNPIFLGYFNLCVESLNNHPIGLISISYLYPLSICIIMVVLVIVSQRCRISSRFNLFKADNTIVKGICVTLLFSFTSVLETSFHIINPVTYFSESSDNDSEYRVSADPNMGYLQSPVHIVLWIIAVLLLITVILPLTFFLLLSPLLMKCHSFIKLKPFLDQFHACYLDKYRWMAGFYFLNRLLYFSIIITPSMNIVNSYPYIRILSVVVAIVHCYIQPYRSRLLNISDAIILSDIAVLSLLYEIPENSLFGFSKESSRVILTLLKYTFLYIPSIYLLLLLSVFAVKKSSKLKRLLNAVQSWLNQCLMSCVHCRRRPSVLMESSNSSDEDSVTLNFKTENNANYASNCREPLISLIGQPSPTQPAADAGGRSASPNLSSGSLSPEVLIHEPRSQPSFYELDGTGGIKSCDDRGDSFVVLYERYKNKNKAMSAHNNEMIDVSN